MNEVRCKVALDLFVLDVKVVHFSRHVLIGRLFSFQPYDIISSWRFTECLTIYSQHSRPCTAVQAVKMGMLVFLTTSGLSIQD